jgi:hypothetical protein
LKTVVLKNVKVSRLSACMFSKHENNTVLGLMFLNNVVTAEGFNGRYWIPVRTGMFVLSTGFIPAIGLTQ